VQHAPVGQSRAGRIVTDERNVAALRVPRKRFWVPTKESRGLAESEHRVRIARGDWPTGRCRRVLGVHLDHFERPATRGGNEPDVAKTSVTYK
jgi:hypothetical protein